MIGTERIDLHQLHGLDARMPMVLGTLDSLMRAGNMRYVGCSTFSGCHRIQSLAISEKAGVARYVTHQAYYSLVGRDYEWELMPLALDQKIGTVVWSSLGRGRRTEKGRRGQTLSETMRLQSTLSDDIGPRLANVQSTRFSTPWTTWLGRPTTCRSLHSTRCCSARWWRLSSSARATKSNWARTWAQSAGN